jgi:hypothetical protein
MDIPNTFFFGDNFKFHPSIFKKLINVRNEQQICK